MAIGRRFESFSVCNNPPKKGGERFGEIRSDAKYTQTVNGFFGFSLLITVIASR
jgi:hypothetical protein